jgi:mono/diheme cytochrome c family protein
MTEAPANILTAEPAEPKAGGVTMPMWLIMLLCVVGYWGVVYFDSRGGAFHPQVYAPYATLAQVTELQPAADAGAFISRGKVVFESVCALCHGADGLGKPAQAPPLAGSEWVSDPADRVIRIALHGLSGAIAVKGQEWNLAMPAMGASLPENDLAAVLTYIRQAWGNRFPAVSVEEIRAVKAAHAGRAQPWTAGELKSVR